MEYVVLGVEGLEALTGSGGWSLIHMTGEQEMVCACLRIAVLGVGDVQQPGPGRRRPLLGQNVLQRAHGNPPLLSRKIACAELFFITRGHGLFHVREERFPVAINDLGPAPPAGPGSGSP